MTLLAASGPVIPHFGRPSACVRDNGTFCWSWFSSHWSGTFEPALVQHLVLVGIAMGIGFVISMAAALIAYRLRWIEAWLTGLFTLLFTIPSIALFELLVPGTGLTLTTAEIALTSYTLLVMYANFVTGLREVPADVREAAEGMGLTRFQRLRRVDLPLAIPAIMAGIRVAAVTVISLAAVAAYVYNYGLGVPILNAIQASSFKTELIAGALIVVLLALVIDVLLVGTQRLLTPWNRERRAWRSRGRPAPAPARPAVAGEIAAS